MARLHFDHITAVGFKPGCPADVLAIPSQATFCAPGSYDAVTFGCGNVPAGFGAERPVMRDGCNIYVYCTDISTAYFYKLDTNEPSDGLRFSPDREAIAAGVADAELNDFDVTVVGSCFHYLAENSYGFNTTHPNYTEEKWLLPLVEQVKAYHGEAAFQTIDTLVNIIGMVGYDLHDYRNEDVEVPLLQAAQVQSEYHRQVRSY